MILLTGATGTIGRHLLEELADADVAVRVLARDPAKLAGSRGALDVVAGDLDVPATLEPALKGVDKVFLLTAGPNVPAHDAAVIDAAARAGVEHLVMVSSLGAELGGIAGGRPHLAGEARLAASGLGATLLHPSEFMSNALWWRETIETAGSIFMPTGDGPVGFVDPADIAAVAAHVLTTEGHLGQTYRLTGPQALTTAQVAATLSESTGKPIRHVDLSPEAFRATMEQAGLPPAMIDMQVEYCAAVRAGTVDIVTDDIERLLGRPANDFRAWARTHADAFGAPLETSR